MTNSQYDIGMTNSQHVHTRHNIITEKLVFMNKQPIYSTEIAQIK